MHQTHCYCAYLQSCCNLFFVASLHPSLSFALFISPSFPPAIFICLAISLPSLSLSLSLSMFGRSRHTPQPLPCRRHYLCVGGVYHSALLSSTLLSSYPPPS